MAEADAKYRNIGFQEAFDGGNGVIAWLRITRAVGQEDAVRIHFQHVFRRGLRWHHGEAAAAIHQHAQDVTLGAVIVGHYMVRQFARRFSLR
ncbi:hypothetical protein D3C72_1927960 [compost metagenome]